MHGNHGQTGRGHGGTGRSGQGAHIEAPVVGRKLHHPAPAIGQHNREILAALGVDDGRYRELAQDGAVHQEHADR